MKLLLKLFCWIMYKNCISYNLYENHMELNFGDRLTEIFKELKRK